MYKRQVLGFVFDADASVKSQAAAVKAKLHSRTWALERLKKCGLSEKDLVKVYKTSIRSVAEYVSVIWHSMLTDEQSDLLERQQNQALKMISGPKMSARKMRARAGINTLKERRVEACRKFVVTASKSPRFCQWFTQRPPSNYERRTGIEYNRVVEKICHSGCCYNSPIYFYRRLLNNSE